MPPPLGPQTVYRPSQFCLRRPLAVRIAGAGLTGLVAATTAARMGERVEIFEAKTRLLPSTGPHTEALRNYGPVDALEELRSYGFHLRPFAEVSRAVRRSEHFENMLLGNSYYLFMRGREDYTVDQQLLKEALDLGVELKFGTRAPDDVDIVATGPPGGRFNMMAAGYTFSAEGANLDPHTVIALLDNTVAPGGYLAITPGIEYHSIYSGSWTDLSFERVLELAKRAFDRPWIQEILGTSKWIDKIYGKAYYARDPIASAVREGARYAGEAGGFQDAVAAYGFRYAVITGALAARSVVESSDYRKLLAEVFRDEFQKAFTYRQKLDRATNEDFDTLVRSMGPELSLEDYLRRREHLRAL